MIDHIFQITKWNQANEKINAFSKTQKFIWQKNKTEFGKEKRSECKYDMYEYHDYDDNGIDDIIVTREGQIYSYNGYNRKRIDCPFRYAHSQIYPKNMQINEINDIVRRIYIISNVIIINEQDGLIEELNRIFRNTLDYNIPR